MKLLQANIDGFGQLHDLTVPLDSQLVLIYGPNEAGKSTIYQFITSILFGFAKRSNKQLRLEPVFAGKHGGELFICNANLQPFSIQRYSGENQGKPLLRKLKSNSNQDGWLHEEMGAYIEQGSLERDLLSGINERLFQQLCAITLSDLQETTLLSSNELSQYLYHSSWDSGKHIAQLEKMLQQELEQMYRPKGQLQPINKLTKRYMEIQTQLQQMKGSIDWYNELLSKQTETEWKLSQLEQQLPNIHDQFSLFSRALNHYPLWLKEKQLEQLLVQSVYTLKLPLDLPKVWDSFLHEREVLANKVKQCQIQLLAWTEQKKALTLQPKLLQHKHFIEELQKQWPKVKLMEQEIKMREDERVLLFQKCAEQIKLLPGEWTKQTIEQLDPSYLVRDQYEFLFDEKKQLHAERQRIEQSMHIYQDELMMCNNRIDKLQEDKVNVEQQIRLFREKHGIIPTSKKGLDEVQNLIKEAFRQYEYSKNGLNGERSGRHAAQRSSTRLFPVLAFISVFVLCTIMLMFSIFPKWQSLMFVTQFICFVAVVALSRRSVTKAKDNSEAQLVQILHALSAMFMRPTTIATHQQYVSSKAAIMEIIDLAMTQQTQKDEILGQIELVIKESNLQKGKIEQKKLELARNNQALERLEEKWQQYLEEHQLPFAIEIEQFKDTIKHLKQIKEELDSLKRMDQLIERYDNELNHFYEQFALLKRENWYVDWPENEEIEGQLYMMMHEVDNQQQVALKIEQLQLQIHQKELEHSKLEEELQTLNHQLHIWLEQTGARSEHDLESMITDLMKRKELEQELQMIQIERTAGLSSEMMATLENLYAEYDEQGLRQQMEKIKNEQSDLQLQQQQWLQQKGRYEQEIDSVLQKDERSQLLIEQEQLLSELTDYVTRYASLSLSQSMLEQTKDIYEQQRQPAVLHTASQYFSQMTKEKYKAITVNVDEKSLLVRNDAGMLIPSDALSRGTAEQLYLSISLALAEEASTYSKLPLLLDDPYVNFDRSRLECALQLTNNISQKRQIIYFTCHEHMKEMFQQLCPHHLLVEL